MIYLGLLAFFVLEYTRPVAYLPALSILHLNSLTPLAIVLGSLFSKGGVPNREIFADRNARLVLFLMGLLFVHIFIVEVTFYAVTIFEVTAGFALVFWVMSRQISDLSRFKGVCAVLVLVHVIVAAMTPQMFLNPDTRHAVAAGSFLGDGNDFALSVNITIPFCLFLLFESKQVYRKLFYGALFLAFVLSIVATKSRGGTLALASVGFYYWLKSDRKFLTASLATIAVGVILLNAPDSYFERMNTISTTPQDGSAQGRLIAWGAAVRMAADNPLFGVGAGHFPVMFGTTYKPAGVGQMPWITAHSIYFLILGELGLPGIAFLLTFIIWNIRANRRLARQLEGKNSDTARTGLRLLAALSAALVAYAVGGAFLSAIYYPHVFVLAGLMVSGRRVARIALEGASEAVPAAAKVIVHHPALRPVLGAARIIPRQIANS